MSAESCAKCNKAMARVTRWFQCAGCRAWFCPSCMDRFCLFCKGAVRDVPAP